VCADRCSFQAVHACIWKSGFLDSRERRNTRTERTDSRMTLLLHVILITAA
jgi:hypothetical protein